MEIVRIAKRGRPRNPLLDELAEKEVGSITILVKGEHFDEDVRSVQSRVQSGLAYRGVRTSTKVVGDTVLVQIITKGEK